MPQHPFIVETSATRACMAEALEEVRKVTTARGYRLLDDDDAEHLEACDHSRCLACAQCSRDGERSLCTVGNATAASAVVY